MGIGPHLAKFNWPGRPSNPAYRPLAGPPVR
jgi:hypothetical protein